jgi:TRAP-type C4-dicarboxylate transport system substrate-binding protein
VSIQNQNLAEFESLLKRALAIDPDARPEWRFRQKELPMRLRRHTTRLAIVLALAAIICPGSAMVGGVSGTAGPIRIKLATLAPKDTSYYRLLLEMGDKWRKASDGQVDLTVFPGGTQGGEAETVQRMNVGQLHAGMLTVGGLSEIDSGVAALQEIPMLFRSLEEVEYVREKMRPDLEKRLLAKGYVSLFWGDSGWVRFFSRNAATRPDDFKTMKIFVTASGDTKELQIMQALGYKPVALNWTDVLIQLQTHGIDALPVIPVLALSGQYIKVTKHMVEVNWAPIVGATVLKKDAWDAIPQATRDALMQAALETGKKIQEAGRKENETAVQVMKTLGVTVHPVTPELDQEWRTFAENIYPKVRGSLVPADMFDRARQVVAEYRASHPDVKR